MLVQMLKTNRKTNLGYMEVHLCCWITGLKFKPSLDMQLATVESFQEPDFLRISTKDLKFLPFPYFFIVLVSCLLTCLKYSTFTNSEYLTGSVIQATGTVKFEDGLRMGVLPGGCWCSCGGSTYPRINIKPPRGWGLVLGWMWLSEGPHFRPNSNLLGSAHCWY